MVDAHRLSLSYDVLYARHRQKSQDCGWRVGTSDEQTREKHVATVRAGAVNRVGLFWLRISTRSRYEIIINGHWKWQEVSKTFVQRINGYILTDQPYLGYVSAVFGIIDNVDLQLQQQQSNTQYWMLAEVCWCDVMCVYCVLIRIGSVYGELSVSLKMLCYA